MLLFQSPNAAKLKVWVSVPNGTLGEHWSDGPADATTAQPVAVTKYTTPSIQSGGTELANFGSIDATLLTIRGGGHIRATGPGSTILKWGQRVATATDTKVLRGSYLRYKRIS